MVLYASCPAVKDLLSASQIQLHAESIREAHKGIGLAIDEHVPGALHVCLFVADERLCGQDFGHPLFSKPAGRCVFAKRAVTAWFLYVWQFGHGSDFSLLNQVD